MIKVKLKSVLRPILVFFLICAGVFFILDNILMPWYVQKGKIAKVPNLIGLPFEEARRKLDSLGLKPIEAEHRMDKRFKVGLVIAQVPQPNAEVKFGRGVYLTISSGEEQLEVPNLRGKSMREAIFTIERHGLKVGAITYETSEEFFPNTVIRQNPHPNFMAKIGSNVDIVISLGSSSGTAIVPDLAMKTLMEAEKLLNSSGFKLGKINYQSSKEYLPNTIIAQDPQSGEIVKIGTAIDLTIAQKEEKEDQSEKQND